jgi:hypothetical protein
MGDNYPAMLNRDHASFMSVNVLAAPASWISLARASLVGPLVFCRALVLRTRGVCGVNVSSLARSTTREARAHHL